jgi:hypothetical protein
MRKSFTLMLAVALSFSFAAPALSLTDTTTEGKICGHLCPQKRLETFGGYVFKGRTKPSKRGQIVRFYFHKKGKSEWHQFGKYKTSGIYPAFRSHNVNRRYAKVRSQRWSLRFGPYKPGRWVLKAKFFRQNGYASSSVIKHVRVVFSE